MRGEMTLTAATSSLSQPQLELPTSRCRCCRRLINVQLDHHQSQCAQIAFVSSIFAERRTAWAGGKYSWSDAKVLVPCAAFSPMNHPRPKQAQSRPRPSRFDHLRHLRGYVRYRTGRTVADTEEPVRSTSIGVNRS